MKTYRLQSSNLVHTPGIIAWAINGYAFKKDRKRIREIVSSSYSLPPAVTDDLLSGNIKYFVENETVIFTVKS